MACANEQLTVNSQEWWDWYFKTHWDNNDGGAQTRHFMELVIDGIPTIVRECCSTKGTSLMDWGCAFGEGVERLAAEFPLAEVVGVDFSEEAVREARRRFPARAFVHSKARRIVGSYDVIVTSNCLEHFEDPIEVLQTLLDAASKLIVVLVPYDENPLCEQHVCRFTEDTLPEQLGNFRRVHAAIVDSNPRFWDGQQLLVVYSSDEFFHACATDHVDYLVDSTTRSIQSLALANAKLRDLRHEHEALRHEHEALRQEHDVLMLRHHNVTDRLAMVEQSVSWRLTAPLRHGLDGAMAIQQRLTPSTWRNGTTLHYDKRRRSDYLRILQSHGGPVKGTYVLAATIDWNVVLFQRPHHLAREMAKRGYLVFFQQIGQSTQTFEEVDEGVYLCGGEWTWEWLASLRDAFISVYSTSPACFEKREVITSLLRPEMHNQVLYEYIDHVSEQISGIYYESVVRLRQLALECKDRLLFLASARALATELTEHCGIEPERLALVSNGVDCRHFRSVRIDDRSNPPEEIRTIAVSGKPIVGYYGAIAPWLDYDLIRHVAAMLPEIAFLFIGPDYNGGSQRLPDASNLHWIGPVDYEVLPIYAKHFDAAVIPFVSGDVARTTSPLKLFEYFALEKPVVVTSSMDECTAFHEVFHGESPEEFAAAIRRALAASDDVQFRERLHELAEMNSWERRTQVLDEFLQLHRKQESAK